MDIETAYEHNTAKAMEYRERADKAEADVERLRERDAEWRAMVGAMRDE